MWDETREDSPALLLVAWIVAAVLLLGFLIAVRLQFSAKSAGFGELEQIGSGWAYRKSGEWKFNAKEPPLGMFLLALPVRAGSADDAASLPGWTEGDGLKVGGALLGESVGRRRLFAARWVSLLFALAMAVGVFRWSFQLWGPFGGLFSLAMFLLSPATLGFAGLATVDMAAAAFGFYAIYGFWRAYHDQSLGRALFAAFCAAAAAGCSYLGAATYLLLGGLAVLGVFFGDAFYPWSGPGEETDPRSLWLRMVWNYVGVLMLCALVGWLALSALHGFDFSINWYRTGLADFVSRKFEARPVFFAGEYRQNGFLSAPLSAFWRKTHPAILVSALLGFSCVRRGHFYDTVYLVVAGVLALAGATVLGRTGHVNELLLAWPVLAILAGAMFQTPLLAHAPHVLAGIAGLIWLLISSCSLAPDYFAYANFFGGGPNGAIRRFDVGDRDRGRDVPALRRTLANEPDAGVTVFFPSLGQPHELHVSKARNLADSPDEIYFPWPGLYAVGLADLQAPSLFGRKGFRFHWLQDYQPERIVGSGLLLFRFETANGDAGSYDTELQANRISPDWLWQQNRQRLDAVRAANPDDSLVNQTRAAGLFNEGIARLNEKDYNLAVENLLAARKEGIETRSSALSLAIGLATAYRELGRVEALRDEIAAIREIDENNPVADQLQAWLDESRAAPSESPASAPAPADSTPEAPNP